MVSFPLDCKVPIRVLIVDVIKVRVVSCSVWKRQNVSST